MKVHPIPSPPRRRGPRFYLNQRGNIINALMQIQPVRIHSFNDSELPGPVPFLYLLLAPYRIFHHMMTFIPNKGFQAVGFGEPFKQLVLVLAYPVPQCARHSNIHGAAIQVRHDIDRWKFFFAHSFRQSCRIQAVNLSGAPAFAGVTEPYRGATA